MVAALKCPLNSMEIHSRAWGCRELKEIEEHLLCSSNSCSHPPLRDLTLGGYLNGSTPLLMACRDGELDSVKRIVECWGVDVNLAAVDRARPRVSLFSKSMIRSNIIKGATALFVAAMGGKKEIVSYLIEKGADVLAKTELFVQVDDSESSADQGLFGGESTPLHAALYDWQSTEEESLVIVDLLLEKGADPQARDSNGFTPILLAAFGNNILPKFLILEYFLEREDIDREQKISAMELAGAVLLGHHGNVDQFQLGFEYWHRAMSLRLIDNEEGSSIIKNPLDPNNGWTVEWKNLAELQNVEQHPSQRIIQSLLVRLRIISGLSWTAFLHFWRSPRITISDELHELSDYDKKLLNLSFTWTMLETLRRFDPTDKIRHSTTLTLEYFVDYLLELDNMIFLFFVKSDIMKILFELAMSIFNSVSTDDANQEDTVNICIFNCLLKLFVISSRLPNLDEDLKQSLREIIMLQNIRDVEHGYSSLLHEICSGFASLYLMHTVSLLLELGADPHTVDNNENSPLHVLALRHYGDEHTEATARLLIEYGAHIDRRNIQGQTAAQIWIQENGLNNIEDLPDWCRENVSKLTCLTGRMIHRENIPHLDDERLLPGLPRHLYSFIKMH